MVTLQAAGQINGHHPTVSEIILQLALVLSLKEISFVRRLFKTYVNFTTLVCICTLWKKLMFSNQYLKFFSVFCIFYNMLNLPQENIILG